jgi:SlyX protein
MDEVARLRVRLNEVEAHLAHQQVTIRELSDVAAAQWKTIDALQQRVAALTDQLRAAQSGALSPADERPPPHY